MAGAIVGAASALSGGVSHAPGSPFEVAQANAFLDKVRRQLATTGRSSAADIELGINCATASNPSSCYSLQEATRRLVAGAVMGVTQPTSPAGTPFVAPMAFSAPATIPFAQQLLLLLLLLVITGGL